MPIYEYQSISDHHCSFCKAPFEKLQKLSEPALTVCPKCNAAVRRVISAPNITSSDTSLDPNNLEKHGFTQYRKASKGVYEKTAGKGPKVISDD